MNAIPSKQDAHYLLAMLDSGLIDSSYTIPWAERIIVETGEAPQWLWDLSTKKYQGDQLTAVSSFVHAEPFGPAPSDIGKFYLACLLKRHLRNEWSWATLLKQIGEYLDAQGCEEPWDCETPYYFLNVLEDGAFTEEVEKTTKEQYFTDQDFRPLLQKVETYLDCFPVEKRLQKTQSN
ncbi:MAG: hypothetical protein AAF085_14295 [Planctomycetota bacterium]